MKTIKQIADEIGVSKQAVTYRLKQLQTAKGNEVLSVKKDGVLVVSLAVETLIKQAFVKNATKTFGGKEPPNDHQKNFEILSVLQATIDTLQKQLEVKDYQIAELTSALVFAQQTADAAQRLHAGTIHKQLTGGRAEPPAADAPVNEEPMPKPGIFDRFKRIFQ